MNLHLLMTHPEKLSKMTLSKLKHTKQQVEHYLVNYKDVCKNYPKRRHEKCSVPHIKKHTDFMSLIEDEIKKHEWLS